jgi:tetratricopeptide (TPR) repeat protein
MRNSALVSQMRGAQGRDDWPLAAMLAADLRCFDPDDPAGYEVGAAVARALGRLGEAAALLAEAAARFPDVPWPLLEAAWTARAADDLDAAIRLTDELRQRFPRERAGYRLGAVFLQQRNRLEQAEAVFRAAATHFPGESWPEREAEAMARRRGNRAAAARLAATLREPLPPPPAAGSGGTVVAVLGMHRAGTSLCARVVQALGVGLGGPLLPPNFSNPEGFQEHVGVIACHEVLLMAAAAGWDTIRAVQPLPAGFWRGAKVDYAREQIGRLVAEQLAAAGGAWAFKDPRTVRFLPVWREVFEALGVRPVWLLAVRAPDAVAASLAARDGIPAALGELLWLEHYLDALRELGQRIALVVQYERWFSEPLAQARALAAALGGAGEGAVERAADMVRAELRHHQADPAGARLAPARTLHEGLRADPPDLAALQRDAEALWRALSAAARDLPAEAAE